ncbi:hypothetical protein Tco_0066471 [Tanacetum coccineum]
MEITSLAIFVDSQLLVNQIKGTYAAKQPTIREYLQKTKEAWIVLWGDLQVVVDFSAGWVRVLWFGIINLIGRFEVGGCILFLMFMSWKLFLERCCTCLQYCNLSSPVKALDKDANAQVGALQGCCGHWYIVPTGRVVVPTGSDEEEFKISSNPLFDLDEVSPIDDEVLESITSIPPGIDSFDAESDLIESLLNRDTSINDSQKIDSLLDEFAGELTLPHSIPPGIDDINLDPEGDILFLESLLYDNSSPRLSEEFNYENPTESFSPSPIPVKDSDSLIEEIDIFLDGDDSIPPGIESDDFDSEDDDNSTSRPEFELFHVDYPDLGDSTIDVVEDIPVDVPNILPTHPALQLDFDFIPSNDLRSDLDDSSPSGDRNKIYDPGICIEVKSTRFLSTLSPVIDTLLPFSSENEDKVFNHSVLAYKEKSPPYSSYRGLKAFQLSPESPMLIHGDNTPNLGVRHPHFYPP